MKLCVTSKKMKEIEKNAIDILKIPAIVLMERAAFEVARVIEENISDKEQSRVFIFVGSGNNGADGIATARILFLKNILVTIVKVGNNSSTSEYDIQMEIAQKLKIEIVDFAISRENIVIKEKDIIIDGLFGIGLSRKVSGIYEEVVEYINESRAQKVIAIDIPSGLAATNGAVLGRAVRASETVTFQFAKMGLYLNQGKKYSGKVLVADIGIPHILEEETLEYAYALKDKHNEETHILEENSGCAYILEEKDMSNIPTRDVLANKGTYGKLLLIAGAEGMSGAAFLAAKAAYRVGAGLVKIFTVEANREVLQTQLPEAIITTYNKVDYLAKLEGEMKWASHIVIGPGMGVDRISQEIVKRAMETKLPMVMDSDALNIIASIENIKRLLGEHILITPHIKEMSRLTGMSVEEIKENIRECGQDFVNKYKVNLILKDATSVIVNAAGSTVLNINGTAALAKGGSGDVLAGIAGGLLCIGVKIEEVGEMASYIHARAGSEAGYKMGMHSVLATDLIKEIKLESY